jgi:hypothetical protein
MALVDQPEVLLQQAESYSWQATMSAAPLSCLEGRFCLVADYWLTALNL